MSLKLKILYSYTILLAVSLGIVGYLLLRNSFTVSLETQIDRGMEEHQLIVSAIQAEIVDQIVNDSFTGRFFTALYEISAFSKARVCRVNIFTHNRGDVISLFA